MPLSQAVVLLATAPKSNSASAAIGEALSDVKKGRSGEIPRHLKNMHADGAEVSKVEGYKYAHNYENHWVRQQYLPDELKDRVYYKYGDNKTEQAAKAYWEKIKSKI